MERGGVADAAGDEFVKAFYEGEGIVRPPLRALFFDDWLVILNPAGGIMGLVDFQDGGVHAKAIIKVSAYAGASSILFGKFGGILGERSGEAARRDFSDWLIRLFFGQTG